MTVRVRFLVLLLLAALTLAGGCGQRSWQSGGVPGSKPYTVRGKTYYPLKSAHGFVEVGTASWYGPGFHGKTTSSGERFNQYAMTAAHKILPLGTKVRVTNIGNGKSVIVRSPISVTENPSLCASTTAAPLWMIALLIFPGRPGPASALLPTGRGASVFRA